MTEIGIPFPDIMALVLSCVDFIGGLMLMVGLPTTICAIALTIAIIVAIVTEEIDLLIPKGLGFFDWMSWFLYLLQRVYVILFGLLMTAGPRRFSLDHFLATMRGVDRR